VLHGGLLLSPFVLFDMDAIQVCISCGGCVVCVGWHEFGSGWQGSTRCLTCGAIQVTYGAIAVFEHV
jgi:hypothetical protein